MAELLFSAIALTLSCLGFHNAYCLSSIGKAYLGIYKGLLDESVVVVLNGGEYTKPQFYLPRVNKLLGEYFAVTLAPYCESYSYYVANGDAFAFPWIQYADSIVLFLSAKVSEFKTVSRTAQFHIQRSDYVQHLSSM